MLFWSIVIGVIVVLLAVSWWVGRGRTAPQRMERAGTDPGSLQGAVHKHYTDGQPHH